VDDARTTYCCASDWFLELAAAIPPGLLGGRASPEWTVLQLLAHANRSHVLVVEYVERPVDPATIPPDYASPANIERRATEAVRALGDDPLGEVRASAARARRVLATAAPDCPVGTPFGRMTLDEYLPSRTAELVLHGVDLARATGQPATVPNQPMHATAHFLLGRAIEQGRAADVALALSGRGALPPPSACTDRPRPEAVAHATSVARPRAGGQPCTPADSSP
jgi:hypothetical protein